MEELPYARLQTDCPQLLFSSTPPGTTLAHCGDGWGRYLRIGTGIKTTRVEAPDMVIQWSAVMTAALMRMSAASLNGYFVAPLRMLTHTPTGYTMVVTEDVYGVVDGLWGPPSSGVQFELDCLRLAWGASVEAVSRRTAEGLEVVSIVGAECPAKPSAFGPFARMQLDAHPPQYTPGDRAALMAWAVNDVPNVLAWVLKNSEALSSASRLLHTGVWGKAYAARQEHTISILRAFGLVC